MDDVKRLLPLVAATICTIIGLGIITPVLPYLTKGVGASDALVAMIFSAFSAASFLASPGWGRLSDIIGRKPVLLISAGLTVLSYIWLGMATNLWEVYASRIMAGLSAGWLATAQAYVSDVTSAEKRTRGMGLLGASFGIGFTIGPGLGALVLTVSDGGYLFVTLASAFFSLAGLTVAWFFVGEPQRDKVKVRQKFSPLILLKNHDIARICGLYFLIYLMFTAMEGTFALWGLTRFGLTPAELGLFLVFGGVTNALIQGGLIGVLNKKFGEARLVTFGVVAMFCAMVSMLGVQEKWQILLPMALFSCAMGLVIPAVQSMLTRLADEDSKGVVTGAGQSMASLARILGPIWGGVAFSYGVSLPYSIASILLIPIAGWAFLLSKRYGKALPA